MEMRPGGGNGNGASHSGNNGAGDFPVFKPAPSQSPAAAANGGGGGYSAEVPPYMQKKQMAPSASKQ